MVEQESLFKKTSIDVRSRGDVNLRLTETLPIEKKQCHKDGRHEFENLRLPGEVHAWATIRKLLDYIFVIQTFVLLFL